MAEAKQTPPWTPEADWTLLPRFPSDGVNQPFLDDDPERVRLELYHKPDETVVGRAWFGTRAQGPPGSAHGGSIVSVLDEAMGARCWLAGHRVVAAKLTTNFRKRIPLGTIARVEAWLTEVVGRKITAGAKLQDEAGQVYAEAEGLFIQLTPEQFQEIVDQLPARWAGPGA